MSQLIGIPISTLLTYLGIQALFEVLGFLHWYALRWNEKRLLGKLKQYEGLLHIMAKHPDHDRPDYEEGEVLNRVRKIRRMLHIAQEGCLINAY